MSFDPFDRMQRANPVGPDQAPPPPMALAEQIMGSRSTVPGWVVATAAAAVAVFVGGGSILLLRGGNEADVAAATDTSSTAAAVPEAPSTSTTQVTTAVAPPVSFEPSEEVVIYLLVDDPTATGPSPSLIPVSRSLATISSEVIDAPRLAIGFLLAGPTGDEAASVPAFSTAIPDGTQLLDLSVADGVATVDLSAEFAAGSGSYSEIARLEQLVYTLTRFDDIDGIRLEIDGVAVDVFGGHGIVLDDPVVRTEFDTTLPAILIETPAYPGSLDPTSGEMGRWTHPLIASGTANVFEATVSAVLTDADGLIIWEGFTTATCGTGCRGEWELTIPYEVQTAQRGSLIVWEASARDGSQTNVREHPVWLVPAGDAAASAGDGTVGGGECSGALVSDALADQPDLPQVVREKRAAIFAAATACDWDLLGTLIPEAFTFSFGGPGDAIAYWQQLEAQGSEPMRYLAELLDRPSIAQTFGEITYYWWPSAFAFAWDEVPDADREALRPLFDDADFAGFADFGAYIGYRVGITGDGEWVVFVAGD